MNTFALYDATNPDNRHVVTYFTSFWGCDTVEITDAVDGILASDPNDPEYMSVEDARKLWRHLVAKGWKRCA